MRSSFDVGPISMERKLDCRFAGARGCFPGVGASPDLRASARSPGRELPTGDWMSESKRVAAPPACWKSGVVFRAALGWFAGLGGVENQPESESASPVGAQLAG